MNASIKKWLNGKADKATFKVQNVAIGHKKSQIGCGIHDPRPKRSRTRQKQNSQAIKSW